jgi:hypothetical protein
MSTERWHLLANHLEGETIRYSELFSALRVSVERTVEVLAELDLSTTTGYRPSSSLHGSKRHHTLSVLRRLVRDC